MTEASRRPPISSSPPDAWWARLAPPELDLPHLDRGAIREVLRAGDAEAENVEAWLASAARGRGALDLAIGEGLAALRAGDRLAELGYHLGDYAREVLGIEARTALKLAQLARGLRSRPLLRAALRSGVVRLRAAEVVLPVAIGEAEAFWVVRARNETVRALEAAVERARANGLDDDEEWVRFRIGMKPEEREVVDEALAVAGRVLPGSSRAERLEAMAQEFLGEHPGRADGSDARPLGGLFRRTGRGAAADARRRAGLEAETDRWAHLPRLREDPLPDGGFDELATANELDARSASSRATARAGMTRSAGSPTSSSRAGCTSSSASRASGTTATSGSVSRRARSRSARRSNSASGRSRRSGKGAGKGSPTRGFASSRASRTVRSPPGSPARGR